MIWVLSDFRKKRLPENAKNTLDNISLNILFKTEPPKKKEDLQLYLSIVDGAGIFRLLFYKWPYRQDDG